MTARRFLSLGAGVQSSTIALMIEHGEVPPVEAAIFADTQWEPRKVYEWLDWLETKLSFPVYRVSAGSLRDNLISKASLLPGEPGRCASVPFFTSGGGLGRRQCTREYKIDPINRKVRELLGYQPRQRIPAGSAEMLIGISLDEAIRQKPSRVPWRVNAWPLLDRRMTRLHCLQWMSEHGYPAPPKSSCLGCPFHSQREWCEVRKDLDEWSDVVFMDGVIRNGGRGMRESQFMHRSLVPIDRVDFSGVERQGDLWGNECDGVCGL